jgi:hypothetical protein
METANELVFFYGSTIEQFNLFITQLYLIPKGAMVRTSYTGYGHPTIFGNSYTGWDKLFFIEA